MKNKLLLLLTSIFIFSFQISISQVPQGIPYQAVARNGQGQPLASTNVKVRFSVLDSTATGTAVYVESQSTTTNALGLFTANVGMGTASTGVFSAINWGKNFKFLKVELDTTTTGNSYIDLGTQQMMSVPYALYAGKSGSISGSNTALPGTSLHGSVNFNGSGQNGFYIIPSGVTILNLLVAGSVGGKAGDRLGLNGATEFGGYGGSCGFANVLISVIPGDTLFYNLGANGTNGASVSCGGIQCCGVAAQPGTSGALTTISINNSQIISIVGGGGGQPSYYNSGCSLLPIQPATNGYLDTSSILNSGAFILSTSNDFNISSNTLLIRY